MKNKKLLALIALLLALCVTVGCAGQTAQTATQPQVEPPTTAAEVGPQVISAEEKFALCKFDAPQLLHTEVQHNYLVGRQQLVQVYAKGDEEKSFPMPVTLSWEYESEAGLVRYEVLVSEDENFTAPQTYDARKSTRLALYNCKIGANYCWRVRAVFDNAVYESGTGRFSTVDETPRNLYISGITNVRDLGGWQAEGGRIKQGLIYRCGRLTANDTGLAQIDKNGIAEMRRLGIRTEIDLRQDVDRGGITKSALGADVEYIPCQMSYDGNMLLDNADMVKKVFSILADEQSYPLIFHCSIGTDRTGMVAFLLGGLLGVSTEDLYWDYLFSNFGNIGGSRTYQSSISKYVATLNERGEETMQKRIEAHLLSIGVTAEEIESIRSILIEK